MGWLEGAIRLFPAWETRAFGYTIAAPFYASVLMPGLLFGAMYAYPFIERRLTGDRDGHELLDRPRDHPVRTAVGAGVVTYLIVLVIAGSQDIVAAKTGVPIQSMVWALRIAVLTLPLVTATIAWAWCRGLSQATTGTVEEPPGHLRGVDRTGNLAPPGASDERCRRGVRTRWNRPEQHGNDEPGGRRRHHRRPHGRVHARERSN